MTTTQFDRIYHGLATEVGKFRIAASGMAWKGEENEDIVAMASADIKWAQRLRVARNFQLRIGLKDRRRESFDGFTREDHDKLAALLKQHFGVILEAQEISFKGWNWGVTDFQGQEIAFLVSNKTSFELPLNQVANSNIAGRTEVSLEFANTASSSSKKSKAVGDEMVEIRFYVPGAHARTQGSDAGSQKSDAESEGEETSAAQAFHEAIKEKAELGQATGVLSFEEVLVLTPRGRYDVDMFLDFLRLRGKTYDYKILYKSISKLFLLPKDDQHILFILGLTTPIRQGQTRYQYLVMQFSREEETTAELNMAEEEISKYERLKKNYEDPTYEVVSGVFRALSGKKIIGTGSFVSRNGHPGIKANLKAVQGDLFLLEKYIFFVSKQPTLIELSDIHQCVYSRVSMGAAARTFDLKVVTKSGPEYTFTSINKEEHDVTENYLKEKKVRIKSEVTDADIMMGAGGDDDDDEMQSVVSDSDAVPRPRTGGNDEDSEDDEDFRASESDEGSPTSSSDSEDGGATASDASGDRELAITAKKKAKAKAQAGKGGDGSKKPAKKKAKPSDAEDEGEKPKKKPKKSTGGDAMDVDGGEKAKPKARPKPKAKTQRSDDDKPAKKKMKASP